MTIDAAYGAALLARLTDFFTEDAITWPRRLWDVGSVLGLEEILEAGSWESKGVLSSGAVDWQRNELRRIIGPDVGLGNSELRRELTQTLTARIPDPSPARRQLSQLIVHARSGYLERWQSALDTSNPPKVERLSRTLAAHLLDLGFSRPFLFHQVADLRHKGATAEETVALACELAQREPTEFSVLVGLVSIPQREALTAGLESWRTKSQVVAWMKENSFSTEGVRVGGGFLFSFSALDAYGAASQARAMVDRLVARSTYLRRDRDGVRPFPSVWVAGHPEPIQLATPPRGADVLSLAQEGHMYRVAEARRQIDDALELAAPLNRGALGPAVAGAWAAIEALLTDPDDPRDDERFGKAVAADRLAAIITCSWPRAELTSLAHHYRPKETPDELADTLAGCQTNLQRSRAFAHAMMSGLQPTFQSYKKGSEYAAASRMKGLLADPKRTLSDVRSALTVAIRRLYRSRNIVLHGGSTQGVALESSLRTAAPLVGAGLDRIVHAALTEGIGPLDLAARAEVSLKLVAGETGLSVVELLEPGAGLSAR